MDIVKPFKEGIDLIREVGGETAKLCYQCGLCNAVCPWNKVRTFGVRRMVRHADFGLAEIGSEEIWLCTTCGSCSKQCPRGVDIIDVVMALRKIASEWGALPESIRSTIARVATAGNPWGENRRDRGVWAKNLSVEKFADGTQILYFPGCGSCYDPRLKKVAVATVNILHQAGVDFGILGDKENCCGEGIRRAGQEELFKRLARENIKAFIENGVRKILVSCPHCFHAFKNEYSQLAVNFEVIHVSRYLAELIDEGRLEFTKEYSEKVVYHDPCYLGRHNSIYDEPRTVLKAVPGLDLAEMADSQENSLCCGGGGGRIWMETPKGERFSNIRLEHAIAAGATVLATFCPYCILNFEDSRLNLDDSGSIEIKDFTEIIQEVINRPASVS
jgi:Fe-S oxidoreductase